MFFGAFIMRYRVELILSFPFVSLVMAIYFYLAFEHESAVQNPEKLYREPALTIHPGECATVSSPGGCPVLPEEARQHQ